MSYFTDEQINRISNKARELSRSRTDWEFFHSLLFWAFQPENADLVADMKYYGHLPKYRDGTFKGTVMINEFAELLEIAVQG